MMRGLLIIRFKLMNNNDDLRFAKEDISDI